MDSQEKDQKQQKNTKAPQPTQDDLYGQQGNQGQYGQGQYDSEGNPDPNGVQAQRIKPDQQSSRAPKKQSPNHSDHYQNVPRD